MLNRDGPLTPALRAPGLTVPLAACGAVLVAAASGLLALWLGQMGLREHLVAVGALALAVGMLAVRERSLFVLFVLVLSIQALFHKNLGPINLEVSGGAWGVYVTSVDVLLIVLYGLWLVEGSLVADLRAAMSQGVVLVPLLALLAAAPSLLVATDLNLAAGELIRMGWMYALYLYVALRVRTRRELAVVLGALLLIAVAQGAVAAWQWRSGVVPDLPITGAGRELVPRALELGETLRPSGTVIHPVFLGAVMGPIALLALSLAINIPRPSLRLLFLAAVPLAIAPMILAQARAALFGLAIAVVVLVAGSLRGGRLPLRAVVAGLATLGALAVLFGEPLQRQVFDNLGSDQFRLELESRLELNRVALDMIADAPLLGVGLNNFEAALDRYDTYGLIFAENPVHNLYLLVWSETGAVGFLGLMISVAVLATAALRLARVPDPLLSGLGAGVGATYVFFFAEEMTVFSLRQDWPLLLFWIVAGLGVACQRIAQREGLGATGPVPPVARSPQEVGHRASAPGEVSHAPS